MLSTYSSIKRALTAASGNVEMMQAGTDNLKLELSNMSRMETEVHNILLRPAAAMMTEYIQAKVDYLNDNFHEDKAAPAGRDGKNCFIYRSHATHRAATLSGTYGGHPNVNNNTYPYSDPTESYSTISHWHIEKVRIKGKNYGSTVDTTDWEWGPMCPPYGRYVETVETLSDVTDESISDLGLATTANQLAITGRGFEFGMEWLHASPAIGNATSLAQAKANNRWFSVTASHGILFKMKSNTDNQSSVVEMGNWYSKQREFNNLI